MVARWLLSALLLSVAVHAFDATEADKAPSFNKAELEELLRKEHSQRISNIYDSENDIQ